MTAHHRPGPAQPGHGTRLLGGVVPEDPHQVGWKQYLDEVAQAGYLYTELGPQGFLPQDPGQLRDELAKRGLTVCGGTVFAGLHKGKEALDKAKEDFGREARLLRRGGRGVPGAPARAVHRHAHRRGDRGRPSSTPSSGRT